jgi:phosphate-selective porin OprO and OprP
VVEEEQRMRVLRAGGGPRGCGGFLVAAVLYLTGGSARADDAMAPSAEAKPAPVDEEMLSLSRLAELEQRANGGAEEPMTEEPVLAGWDKKDGFFIRSADNNFLLKIGGRLQIRYTYKGRDQRGESPSTPEEEGVDDSFFEIERARVSFTGHVLSPNLTYNYTLDGDTDGSGVVDTFTAFVMYAASRSWFGPDSNILNLGAGIWKPHYLRQEVTSSGRQQFVDRTLANEFFNISRNLGVWVEGSEGPVFYAVGVSNGFDSSNVDTAAVDQIPAFMAKLDFTLMGENERGRYEESNFKFKDDPLFVIGFSGATDASNGSSGIANQNQWDAYQFGIDATFKWSLFSIQGEYMGRWLDYDAPAFPAGGDTSTNYAHGFYVQAGAFLVPDTLEVAGRVSAIWSDGDQGGSGFEAGPVVNWYISKSHKVKLATDVMFFDISDDLPPASDNLEVGTATVSNNFSSSAANIQEGEQGVMLRTQLQLEF